MKAVGIVLTVLCSLTLVGAGHAADSKGRDALRHDYVRPTAIPYPTDNPHSDAKERLGKILFFDARLSGSSWISCASCHNPGLSWGDGLPHAIGDGMKMLPRRSPTLLNVAWADLLMWDGRAGSLEEQALGPISAEAEMNMDVEKLIKILRNIPGYRTAFKSAFGDAGITPLTVTQALATYERTLQSGTAPFDRWVAGDEQAISESAKRGFDLFNGKANCSACHGGWNFTDNGFHDIGLPDHDIGRGKFLPLASMQQAFKTPTLRDVDRRAPYMHDGSLATLSAVIDHYDQGGVQRPSLSEDVRALHLTPGEKRDLLEFLTTLTGTSPPVVLPVQFVKSQVATNER